MRPTAAAEGQCLQQPLRLLLRLVLCITLAVVLLIPIITNENDSQGASQEPLYRLQACSEASQTSSAAAAVRPRRMGQSRMRRLPRPLSKLPMLE
jgi:hypothetical protein